MNKKRALIITTTPYMIKQFLMNDIQILCDLGYEVELATNFKTFNVISEESLSQFKSEIIKMGIKINQIDFERSIMKFSNHLKSYMQIKELFNKNEYTLIHTHTPVASLIARIAFKHSQIYDQCRMIYTAHGFHFFKGNNPIKNVIFRNLEKYGARYTDTLITINKEDYAAAKTFKLRKNGNVVYVPGIGIDIDKINSIQGNREALLKELNILDDSILLLSVGELSKRKNHEIIVRSLCQLPNNVHYLICGQGQLESYLLDLAKELNVENRFHLLGYRTNIPQIMKSCDIFVFPSLQEGLPVALMEAMACGLPCIASDIRGNSDLISEDMNGYLVSDFSVEQWKNAIYEMKKDQNNIKLKSKAVIDFLDIKNIRLLMKEIYL